MAAIWRGFLILGNPLCGLPDDRIKLLEELRDLHKRTICVDDSPQAKISIQELLTLGLRLTQHALLAVISPILGLTYPPCVREQMSTTNIIKEYATR